MSSFTGATHGITVINQGHSSRYFMMLIFQHYASYKRISNRFRFPSLPDFTVGVGLVIQCKIFYNHRSLFTGLMVGSHPVEGYINELMPTGVGGL